ncbi:MAG: UbiA family prenyltransferase [Candidatus Pacebacteria bacterium]|nr:UbiA family prenyltransferase [Candidatus Paceibacterota bacterium]
MRAYLFFLSGMAGYAGVAWAGGASLLNTIAILGVVFIGWGVNQVVNDILGLKEDRINAPHRSLVTGALPLKAAIIISALLFVAGLVVTAHLNIHAIWLYLAVFSLNILYEYAKGVPIAGNMIFASFMPLCFYYGAQCAVGESLEVIFANQMFLGVALGFFLVNFSMCFFTYYKDYEGDKTAGKKTLVVLLSPEKARFTNFVFSLLPFAALFVMPFELNLFFVASMCLNFIMFQYTALAYFKHPTGESTYYNLRWNYAATVLYEVSFIMLVKPLSGVLLYVLCFVGVMGIFQLHKDHLS